MKDGQLSLGKAIKDLKNRKGLPTISYEKLAKRCYMTRATLRYRLISPEDFKVNELELLAQLPRGYLCGKIAEIIKQEGK